jgi:hypothetical protein
MTNALSLRAARRSPTRRLVRHFVAFSASLPRALLESLNRTIELGQGDKDFPAVYESFRPSPIIAPPS